MACFFFLNSLCLKWREALLCWSEVCWKQGCCMCVAVTGMNIPALALGSSCKVTPQLVGIIFVRHFSGSKGFRHWSLGPTLVVLGKYVSSLWTGWWMHPRRRREATDWISNECIWQYVCTSQISIETVVACKDVDGKLEQSSLLIFKPGKSMRNRDLAKWKPLCFLGD